MTVISVCIQTNDFILFIVSFFIKIITFTEIFILEIISVFIFQLQ